MSLPLAPSVKVDATRRPAPRLLLRLYAIGIATAIGIAGSWWAAHSFIHFPWPENIRVGLEALSEVPKHWAAGDLRDELDRVRRTAAVLASVYDVNGVLVASNVQPPFPAPSEAARRAISGTARTYGAGPAVIAIGRGDLLRGYCVFDRKFLRPPLWGVTMDLLIISTWISAVGLLVWRTLVRPLQNIARAAEAFGEGDMAARTGVDRGDEIGKVARAFDDMSERIARSREAERELLAGLSHELRTPMARIRVALDLAAESDAETARASLADVAEDLTELETLIGNIFSTTRLEVAARARDGQPVPLQRTEVDLCGLIETAIAHQRAQHPGRPYVLQLSPELDRRPVYADAILIRRAIENVLDNANKYSPAEVPVTVKVSHVPETRTFRVAISDLGFGIGPQDLPRLFSPFFRADRSRARATGGVGLGLVLAKRVVEAHGGHIEVASQLDAGTTVTFLLPITDRPRDTGAMRNIS